MCANRDLVGVKEYKCSQMAAFNIFNNPPKPDNGDKRIDDLA
jgi:hypothetical protein